MCGWTTKRLNDRLGTDGGPLLVVSFTATHPPFFHWWNSSSRFPSWEVSECKYVWTRLPWRFQDGRKRERVPRSSSVFYHSLLCLFTLWSSWETQRVIVVCLSVGPWQALLLVTLRKRRDRVNHHRGSGWWRLPVWKGLNVVVYTSQLARKVKA